MSGEKERKGRKGQMLRGKCANCSYEFDVVRLPCKMTSFSRAAQSAICPDCGSGPESIEALEPLILSGRVAEPPPAKRD